MCPAPLFCNLLWKISFPLLDQKNITEICRGLKIVKISNVYEIVGKG